MSLPIEDLTPRQIVAELDRYIVGQASAKRAVAVALRNRYRRQQLPERERDDILPKNILMIGPTGVGKTEIARRLAQLARAPFLKVEATKFTEVGYVGRDVESMIRDLAATAVRLVEKERMETVREAAEERVEFRLLDLLAGQAPTRARRQDWPSNFGENPIIQQAMRVFGAQMPEGYPATPEDDDAHGQREDQELAEEEKRHAARVRRLKRDLRKGRLEDQMVEIEVEEPSSPFLQVFTPQGMEEMGLDGMPGASPFGGKRSMRRLTVREAREVLLEEEARRMIDRQAVTREAVQRAEQTGIIFLDELDKVAGKSGGSGPDVSREGVQRDLLPIIEGSTVQTKFGPLKTDHILFIAAGAFHIAKPADLIPELQGRLPIRVELENLTEADFGRILREPQNALTKQYKQLLATEGVKVEFTEDALDEIARMAAEVNAKTENIGARRLHTVMERLLEEPLFEAPDGCAGKIRYDGERVREVLAKLVGDVDLSRYIL